MGLHRPGRPRCAPLHDATGALGRYAEAPHAPVGEHLGYAFTGAWTLLSGAALTQTSAAPTWLGIAGIVIGPILMLCSLEFVGRFERTGWKLAGTLTPITYIAWSLWLVAVGVALLV